MTPSLRGSAAAYLARGEAAVVVEVVEARGSVPREAGTRMLVAVDRTDGTIGGGNLEWRAIGIARRMLGEPGYRPDDTRFALGASLGQCCGGAVVLRWRLLDAASLAAWTASVVVPTVQVYGAGHVGRAVVHVLSLLDVAVQWIDERDGAFPAGPSPANVRRVCVEPVEAEVAHAPADAFRLVMTHRHDLDLRIVDAILRRGDGAWLGLIGSSTKRRRFAMLLAERGFDAASIERIRCPIGLPGLGGKEPAHIAIAVAAELLPLLEAARTAESAEAAAVEFDDVAHRGRVRPTG